MKGPTFCAPPQSRLVVGLREKNGRNRLSVADFPGSLLQLLCHKRIERNPGICGFDCEIAMQPLVYPDVVL